ncbi:alanine dehydrogenase [Denitratisoma oestradiolicum]|uniref:Alanine dehydrogenase n=1 Tax=Denitratisoma oestradiolicum TaxID=311182 RepID=A0A6S6XUY0_9PROT|nr:alanine dehydrogenase [Denitratisoma oestradiolicum]TWO81149.1 alanine dehydrogenase [Denitratisoma oestradiolicum]CAB1367837.1 Alanine dehydrogenase [Denitratisoma oestradiolicum]
MRIGVLKEIKIQEYRVGLAPASVRELVARGHEVWVEAGTGTAIDFTDAAYAAAGARVAPSAAEVWAGAELIVKVKEPQPVEYPLLRPGQILFTYLHLAPDPAQAAALLQSGCVAIAYETVTDAHGGLPLLAPMSAVAGRMAPQVGAYHLTEPQGGRGVLLCGVPGVAPGKVTVLGAGVVGSHAAHIAVGLGADVMVLDRNVERLDILDRELSGRVKTQIANAETVEQSVTEADLVIGAVLLPGGSAPRLIPRSMLGAMKRGAVIVDVAIDQGGCCETSHPTTHADPVFVVDGVVHYCVANMPGAVPRTSALALNNATLPFVGALADKGWRRALTDDAHLRQGLNVCAGQLTHGAVAAALGQSHVPAERLL